MAEKNTDMAAQDRAWLVARWPNATAEQVDNFAEQVANVGENGMMPREQARLYAERCVFKIGPQPEEGAASAY